MIVTIELTGREETSLRRRAVQEGEDEQVLASRLLSSLLREGDDVSEASAPPGRSLADRFAGRVGVVAGSGEAYSELGGSRFAEFLARKHRSAEDRS